MVRGVAYGACDHEIASQRPLLRLPCSVLVLIVAEGTQLERARRRDGEVTRWRL